jgi:hypothetical protein
MSSRHAGRHGNDSHGKREAFRAWRRSRPFWGGLLLLIAGLELLSVPLSGVLIKGAIKLVIYIGIGGVFGAGIGALLIAAGLVMWFNPTHRVFYGVAGIVLGILSFPASNLGGFFLGMLLAIIGGSLAFAWTPVEPAPSPFREDTWQEKTRPASPGHRMLAVAAMPAVLAVGMAGSGSAARAADLPRAAESCTLGIFCSSPSPSPSPTSSGGSGSSLAPVPSSGSQPSPSGPGGRPGLVGEGKPPGVSGSPSPSPSGTSGRSKKATVKHAKAPSGLVAPSATAVLTARSATLKKLNLAGIATLPVGGGASEQALEFTASSAGMSSVQITVTQDGSSVVTKTTSLDFGGGMTLYATKLCGQVEGITPTVCFTPSTASKVVLKLASVLGKAAPITMTGVTTDQFLVSAGTMRWGALTMGAT